MDSKEQLTPELKMLESAVEGCVLEGKEDRNCYDAVSINPLAVRAL